MERDEHVKSIEVRLADAKIEISYGEFIACI